MQVKVVLIPERTDWTLKVKQGAKIYDLIKKLNLNPDTRIALRADMPVPIDSEVIDNDEIELVRVVSGG